MLSSGTGAAEFISMTKPFTLAEKALDRVSNELLLALESLVLVHMY